jgi:hypothetical protein
MKKLSLLCAMALVLAGLCVPQVYATDITIPDSLAGPGTIPDNWYNRTVTTANPGGEDQETETPPNTIRGQVWDLEAFLRTGINLSMVGGYNFKSGVSGFSAAPGDVFIDNITTLHPNAPLYGSTAPGEAVPPNPKLNIYNYNYAISYAIDPTGTSGSYTLYQIDGTTLIQYVNTVKPQADPWKLGAGGLQTPIYTGTLLWSPNLSDADLGNVYASSTPAGDPGYNSSLHYMLTFLGIGDYLPGWKDNPAFDAYFHYTFQCGNDFMMGEGKGISVPLAPSALLLGSGLLGLVGLAWRRRKTNV